VFENLVIDLCWFETAQEMSRNCCHYWLKIVAEPLVCQDLFIGARSWVFNPVLVKVIE
jgi:hypothetical protein